MKENKYDSEKFFAKYSAMNRSKNGLQGAGEWSELRKILPDFAQKRVLDLGCGYGWHCKYALENGAAYVLGTDISHKMLEVAQRVNAAKGIKYQCAAMEGLDFPDAAFDIVLSSLAFHYVNDFAPPGLQYQRLVETWRGICLFSGTSGIHRLGFARLVPGSGRSNSPFSG